MFFRPVTCLRKIHPCWSFKRLLNQMNTMEVKQRQEQAEQKFAELKHHLTILTQLTEQKQKVKEQVEIKRLREENEQIHISIKKLKQDLKFYEVQNGVKNIPIPRRSAVELLVAPTEQVFEKKAEEKEEKREKKPKKEKTAATKGNTSTDAGKLVDVSRLLFKVGKIVDVRKHPQADELYIEEVDLGEANNRTIVSGLVKHITLDEMKGRMAVFMCNLKPRKMRDVLSNGMIMCASTPDKVEILEPPSTAVPGDRVYCEGYPGEPDAQLNPKKKVWETVQPDLRVDSDGNPGYKGGLFTVDGKGTCKAPTMKACPIK